MVNDELVLVTSSEAPDYGDRETRRWPRITTWWGYLRAPIRPHEEDQP